MSLNFKQPKYVLPLVILPFLCLFFYVYNSSATKNKKEVKHLAGINAAVGDVSPEVKKKELADKLDAYRNKYKESDGNTAVNPIPAENTGNPLFNNAYDSHQRKTIDSINAVMKQKFGSPEKTGRNGVSRKFAETDQDRALADAINNIKARKKASQPNDQQGGSAQVPKDPMEMFRKQMAYLDSINKSNDPGYKAEKLKKDALARAEALKAQEVKLDVRKAGDFSSEFNTVRPDKQENFIMAVVDENVTGYAGSRIKLKLMEDIVAGKILIKKGTYVYALINGFSGQRVTLQVKSIAYQNKILPVKLEVYDLDAMPGLYVPESQFRDFTKDASTNVMQGVDIEGNSTAFVMSAADKLFESTSSAIADAIRRNKAKIKYNSYVYLIDPEALQNAQKSY